MHSSPPFGLILLPTWPPSSRPPLHPITLLGPHSCSLSTHSTMPGCASPATIGRWLRATRGSSLASSTSIGRRSGSTVSPVYMWVLPVFSLQSCDSLPLVGDSIYKCVFNVGIGIWCRMCCYRCFRMQRRTTRWSRSRAREMCKHKLLDLRSYFDCLFYVHDKKWRNYLKVKVIWLPTCLCLCCSAAALYPILKT